MYFSCQIFDMITIGEGHGKNRWCSVGIIQQPQCSAMREYAFSVCILQDVQVILPYIRQNIYTSGNPDQVISVA